MASIRLFTASPSNRVFMGYLRFPRFYASQATKGTAEEPSAESDLPVTFVEDEDLQAAREARIEQLRNKSRLLPQHRNMLHNQLPYEQSQSWIHETVKYKRMMLGRYGLEGSKVDPRVCFPTKQERLEKTEYERVAYRNTLQEMMAENKKSKEEKVARIRAREDDVAKKMEKLDKWVADLNARIAKKEAEARAAKERKDRLVEEVRRHFGFRIDPRDERFQEMLAQKEKADRKKVKEAKRKEKEVKMMEKLKKRTADLEDGEGKASTEDAEEVEKK
ncbi:growth arrest and DNA damage-inducible proteins-interacting protein 1 [Aedes aegypti]|uniref:Large ribosomal subunit protein mL64 n=1 Tax=Aedes aegypti TaxID=7159 RepID=A0A1S4F9T1_AEDAE|nr:growth arrest and DNA damage-inducible proteins-interacting protein 1 [Aedes aegypti]